MTLIRATQQVAEALQAGTGVLRATDQFVEALINDLVQIVEQSIAFSQSTQTEGGSDGVQTVEDDLGLTDSAEGHLFLFASVEDTLAFSDSGGFSGLVPASASDTLDFQQSVDVRGPIYEEIHHSLNLTDSSDYPSKFAQAGDVIVFLGAAGRVVEVSVSQAMSFSQTGERTNKIVDTLALSDTIAAGKGGDIEDDLGLSQTIVRLAILNRSTSNTLQLRQTVSYSLLYSNTLCQYMPFVGSTTDPNAPTPPSLALDGPNPDIVAPFQLLYPHTGTVTDSVSVRAPNLGNRDRLSFDRINRETRGGTLQVFADPQWPKIQTLVLSFSGLKRTEAHELLRFMNEHLGVMVGLVDWEQRYWEGVIVTTQDAIVADHHDSYSASFSFEGVLSDNNPEIVPGTSCAGTAKMAKVKAARASCVCIPEVVESGSTDNVYSAESDATVALGAPLYLTGAGHVDLAQANASGTTQVVGLANEAGTPTVSVDYITEGKITKSDWSGVAGTATLTVGAIYYLSATTAGRITTTAPTTGGQYVVKVGRATSATVLDVEIESSIRL